MVDLFAGCGGLTLGAAEAARTVGRGIDVRFVAELDLEFAAIYRKNFKVNPGRCVGDVTQHLGGTIGRNLSAIERGLRARVGSVDLLLGGPPCQGHSTLNNHTRGDDPKNRLYLRMVRAAEVFEPSALFVENVPAIERDAGGVVDVAARALERLGYRVEASIHALTDLGVPQLRKRHVLLAHHLDGGALGNSLVAGRVATPRTVRWAIGDLVDAHESSLDDAGTLSTVNLARAEYLLSNGEYDLPNHLRPTCQQTAHKYKSMYGRLSWLKPAQTITTGFSSPGQGRFLHPSLRRTLTPHEAARIQFFPDWFDFSEVCGRRHLARAIGNAVPPKLSFAVTLGIIAPSARGTPAPARVRRYRSSDDTAHEN